MKLFNQTPKKKRGQAALEFLMTYGWAFLVMIAVIAGIVALDPLSMAQNQGADTCTFTNELQCDSERVLLESGSSPNELKIFLSNRGTSQFTLTGFNYTNATNGANPCDFTSPTQLERGGQLTITCTDASDITPGDVVQGDRFDVSGNIKYYPTRLGQDYSTSTQWSLRTTAR